MGSGIEFINYSAISIEMIYYLIVIGVCFWIYFKTKKIYDLTSYEGLKYFKNTFLYFGLTNLLNFIIHTIILLELELIILNPINLWVFKALFFVMVYTGSLALIYTIYSIIWKNIEKTTKSFLINNYLIQLVSILFAIISLFRKFSFIFLIFQSVLFILLLIASYVHYKKNKNKANLSSIYYIYPLIFALWLTSNILEFITYFSPTSGLLSYSILIALFLIILFKVTRRLNFK